jgi:hypothetical protein
MPFYDETITEIIDPKSGFDLSDVLYSFSRPISVCAFELNHLKDNRIKINNKLKNIAFLSDGSVNCKMRAFEDFKYSIKFDGILVQAMISLEEDKYLAMASIDQLKQYIPENINLDVNKDLMAVAFDAFVVNRGNKNGHIIGTDVALSMVENFVNKPFNIEHNRRVIVGVCTGYGFSEFGSSRPLSLEDIKNTKDPFNVVLSGYIWKVANPEFASELIDSNDPSSSKYLSISASWELGFNEFNIAKGNKNLAEATIIENDKEIVSLKDKLKVFGGNGFAEDGDLLLLNLTGNVLPLGIGFTNNPAAEVSGVIVSDRNIQKNKDQQSKASNYEIKQDVEGCDGYAVFEDGEMEKCFDSKEKAEEYIKLEKQDDMDESEEDSLDENEIESSEIKINKKSVQEENKNVKNTMQVKTIEDITESSIKELAASEVRDFISNKINELASEWKTKVEEKENALQLAEEKLSSLNAEIDKIKTESEQVKNDFSKLQEDLRAKEIEVNFQNRMSLIDEEFELSEEDRSIVAEDLNTIENDEQFEKWYKKFSTLAAAKKKSNKKMESKKVNEEKVKEEVKASENKSVEEIISSAEVKEEVLPNASSPQEASLVEKINAAFNKNSVKIK